ncbi:hypothetical protein [Pararhodobacter sp.]|uniref:hypothetical protein n=1 Tax=Pararhodobacter sp. TaxID=2127056 RepID=UPI002AFE250A|nr:hypothetical protein [Pararhodobacter sp.]
MDYFVCRASTTAPEGVVFFDGSYRLSPANIKNAPTMALVANTTLLRKSAYVGDCVSTEMVADLLNKLGPASGVQGAPQWQAIPAALHMPPSSKAGVAAAAANEVL